MNRNIILYIEKYNIICENILYLKIFFLNLLKKKKLKLIIRFSYIKSNDLV